MNRVSTRLFKESTRVSALRFFAYTLLIFGFTASLPLMVVDGDIVFFKENGPIEWFQFSLLLGATAVFLAGTLLVQAFNPLLAVLACVSAFAASRELDSVLDDVVPVLGWSVAFVFLLAAGTLAYRTRGRLADQVPVFLSSRAFVMLRAGFVVAVPFARLIGDARFLQSLMGGRLCSRLQAHD